MKVNPNQKFSRLGTRETEFEVCDLRGKQGFPKGQRGIAFRHKERREIRCKFTGRPIKRSADYVIRTDDKGWRIDRHEGYGLKVAVYGPNREDYWQTNHEAAAALEWALDEIRDNSSLGG